MDIRRLTEAQTQLPSGASPLLGIGSWDPAESFPDVALDTVLDGIRRAAETQLTQSIPSADTEQLGAD